MPANRLVAAGPGAGAPIGFGGCPKTLGAVLVPIAGVAEANKLFGAPV